MVEFIEKVDWVIVIIGCLTLGLAPFTPEPHIVEKLRMLFQGNLVRPIDWFDFVFHGIPWFFLIAKVILRFR
ncbi:MAG: RND transporter [Deltaproteobacteria bacterium CG2_30_63_29]|nr:MAG: RND transporter [Deltaproteobacteria bacterium CG2_30_63_29]PIW01378.1 MAG: RND transporter [Deltaproteobacteria bacterium CG17_big_fil_post_rev_8_21_14_2_50_63_7]PJB48660.1 MAG: RND transporter [Deltaproteobacteria bacterium CG_4_9_14_3_um_filter_63_12]